MISAGPLRIDPSTGDLILTSTLDFERTTSYNFNVTATNDAGGVVFTDTSSVRIDVMDVNDNAPVYDRVDYSVVIDEGDYTTNPRVLPVDVCGCVCVWVCVCVGVCVCVCGCVCVCN